MIRCGSSSGREYEVPLRSIKSPRVIPQCPRPPKSATQLRAPGMQGASNQPGTARQDSGRTPQVDADPDPDDEPEPREKPVNFSKFLDAAEKDLGWHGKYDNMSDQREQTAGMKVAIKLEQVLEKLRGFMDKHQSLDNRVHILTIMREIMMAVLQTEGSRVGSEVRNCAFQYDDNLLWAAEKLTAAQRRKLKTLDGGAWVRDLKLLAEEAKSYCIFERLPQVLQVFEPIASSTANAEHDSDVEIISGMP
ncbi:hypothetical protein F4781DRAFT_410997 [Annulohypoxylon bovei var. microspora]|nr:hypothetical protein F4781DRAFT_410997 [Annulohypoxylon bovei var. microspora]